MSKKKRTGSPFSGLKNTNAMRRAAKKNRHRIARARKQAEVPKSETSQLEIGQLVRGSVQGRTKDGHIRFRLEGGIPALLPPSYLEWFKRPLFKENRIWFRFQKGAELDLEVKAINSDGRVFVGHFMTREVPWEDAKLSHPQGSSFKGHVLRQVGKKYYLVELNSLFWAWLPARQVPTDRIPKVGDPIRVTVLEHDAEKHRLYVGLSNELIYTAGRDAERSDSGVKESIAADHAGIDEAFEEGHERFRLHREKERDPALVKAKRNEVLAQTGQLLCEACDFDFEDFYGSELGHGFAECHHRTPLASLEPGHQSRTKDLAILCSNCHRVIHRTKDPMWSVHKLREHIQHRRGCEDLEW